MSAVIHIAGPDVTAGERDADGRGRFLRQRCCWCGATLLDYDLTRMAMPTGQDPNYPAVWSVGDFVAVDREGAYMVEHVVGERPPTGSCLLLDPAVTR